MAVGKVRTGVILIAIGVLLLLNTTGVADFGFWRWIGRLWPVILIAIGIEKIFGASKSSNMRNLAWLSPLIIVAVVSYAVVAGQNERDNDFRTNGWQWNLDWDDSDRGPAETFTWTEPLTPDTRRVDLLLDMSGGRMTVRGGSDPGNVLVGRASSRTDKPKVESSIEDGIRKIRVVQRDKPDRGGRDQWIMKLTDSIPIDLHVEGGAARMRLDLTAITVESLDLDAGATDADVVFGTLAPAVACEMDCGAASLDVTIPSIAGLRIHHVGGLSHISEHNLDLIDKGAHMETEGYDTSAVRIEMRINSALTTLRLHRATGPSSGESI